MAMASSHGDLFGFVSTLNRLRDPTYCQFSLIVSYSIDVYRDNTAALYCLPCCIPFSNNLVALVNRQTAPHTPFFTLSLPTLFHHCLYETRSLHCYCPGRGRRRECRLQTQEAVVLHLACAQLVFRGAQLLLCCAQLVRLFCVLFSFCRAGPAPCPAWLHFRLLR